MGSNLIKSELKLLGKKQVDLLLEVQKRGYKRLNQSQFSAYLRGTVNGPQAEAVKKLAGMIIDEWKRDCVCNASEFKSSLPQSPTAPAPSSEGALRNGNINDVSKGSICNRRKAQ